MFIQCPAYGWLALNIYLGYKSQVNCRAKKAKWQQYEAPGRDSCETFGVVHDPYRKQSFCCDSCITIAGSQVTRNDLCSALAMSPIMSPYIVSQPGRHLCWKTFLTSFDRSSQTDEPRHEEIHSHSHTCINSSMGGESWY